MFNVPSFKEVSQYKIYDYPLFVYVIGVSYRPYCTQCSEQLLSK